MVGTINGRVIVLVSNKKWLRGNTIVERIQEELVVKGKLNLK